MRRWWWLFVVLGLAGWALFFGGADTVRDYVTRGKRLTSSSITDGVVDQSIEELLAQATANIGRPVGRDAYSIARMLRSEYSGGPTKALIAMGWTAVNDAAELGRTITWTINAGSRHGTAYGTQEGGGRYSTAHDPYENDLAIAEAILAGEEPDPTPPPGAVKFVHTSGFSADAYAATVEKWAAEGLSPVELGDVGSLVVFVRGQQA